LKKLLQNKKAIRKEKLEERNIDVDVALKFGRETPKQVTDLDGNKLLEYLISNLDDDEYDIITLLKLQKEFSKTVNYVNSELDKKIVMVDKIDSKNNLILYCLNNGKKVTFKVKKALLNYKPIEEGDVLYLGRSERLPKCTFGGKDNKGKPIWIRHYDIMEWNLNDYNIIKEL